MSVRGRTTLGRLVGVGPSRIGYVVLALVAGSMAAATYAIAAGTPGSSHRATGAVEHTSVQHPHRAASARPADPVAPPGPAEFGRGHAGVTAAYAKAHGLAERLANVDCVQASRGHYMCSYAIVRPDAPAECHVMQAVWTPRSDSSFRITVAGRAGTCGSLREGLRSLQ